MKRKRLGERGNSWIYESDEGVLFQKCISCSSILELSIDNFWKQKTTKSGYRSRCKKCLGFKNKKRWGVRNKPTKEYQRAKLLEWRERQPAGIYKITCLNNGRIYIGETRCIPMRWIGHKSALKRPKGKTNRLLQEDWDKYGESYFEFEVIEETKKDKNFLLERELYYINKYHSEGYELYNKERLEDK